MPLWFGLLAVLLAAAVVRVGWLGEIPAGLSHDETVKGYDAWSVLHTGRDQYGERLPLVFRGIGDQREALLPYLIVVSEAMLGPTDFAVRLPAAVAGVALVGAVFLLGRELFGVRAGLLAALFLALSPWHVQVSRLAFRAGLLPLTTALGLWLFLVALKRPRWMPVAGVVLALGLHTYLAARVFVPVLLAGLVVIYRRELFGRAGAPASAARGVWRRPGALLLGGLAIVALPLVVWALGHPAEFAGHAAESAGTGSLPRQVLDALGRYLAYLSPAHLLTQGDPYPVPSTGRFGALYWIQLPLFVAGIAVLVRRRRKAGLLLLWWWLIYPIPASLTRGAHPDWLRATCGIGTLELITAAGAVALIQAGARRPLLRSAVLTFTVLYVANVAWFLHDYTQRFPDRAATAFHDGVAEAVRQVAAREPAYDRVILPDGIPAMHDIYLFYSRYDPRRLHTEGLEDSALPGDWARVQGFGKHRLCDPQVCCGAGDICLVEGAWSGAGETLATVADRRGRTAFTVVAGR